MTIRYEVGSREALEAEYGIGAGANFAIVQFYGDEISQWFPCDTMAEAKIEIAEISDGPVAYLA